jgi:predicted O-methyltransferase YrrM
MAETYTPQVLDYILAQTRFDNPLLTEMEERAAVEGFPIIGPLVGPWLYTLSRMIDAAAVYELGSGYGYSTWYFCKAVQDGGGGEVVHTVWDAKLSADAKHNLTRAGFADIVQFVEGEAVEALRNEEESNWDIIFMDIDKEGYPAALPVIEDKLRKGGLLIVDNLVWSGAVADESDQRASTQGIRELTRLLRESPRWELLILPLRDGVGVCRFLG